MQGEITERFRSSVVHLKRAGEQIAERLELRRHVEVQTRQAFGDVVCALLDTDDPQLDLRRSPIDALETFEDLRPQLLEPEHRRRYWQSECRSGRAVFWGRFDRTSGESDQKLRDSALRRRAESATLASAR